jgi:small subunit ribosomal protein S13
MKKIKNKTFSNQNLNFGLGDKKKLNLRKIFGLNIRKAPRKSKLKIKDQIKKILFLNRIGKVLKNKIKKTIQFYIDLKSYKGFRHKFKYPVRGQRTKTNAKTVKKTKI